MELKEVMLRRRSIRKFTDEKIKEEDISTLLHYAMSGPSACNRRPWIFYVVTNEEKLEQLNQTGHYTDYKSPLKIVVCGNHSRFLPVQLADYWIHDCAAAIENILLGATDLGLGACWIGIYPQKRKMKKVSQTLSLNEKDIPLAIISIGVPEEDIPPRDQYEEKCVKYVR